MATNKGGPEGEELEGGITSYFATSAKDPLPRTETKRKLLKGEGRGKGVITCDDLRRLTIFNKFIIQLTAVSSNSAIAYGRMRQLRTSAASLSNKPSQLH
jgi:hypothetical protein